MSAIETVLVANRGEIAVRVMRTAKGTGVKDDCRLFRGRRCGTARAASRYGHPARRTRLRVSPTSTRPAILEAAQKAGADAVHPGYGFFI
jgi:acetyl/propionyl-CoA carboxylase alpha subunit